MNAPEKYKNYSCIWGAILALSTSYSFFDWSGQTAYSRSVHRTRIHATNTAIAQRTKTSRQKRHTWSNKKTAEQLRREAAEREAALMEAARRQEIAREAAAREAEEIRLNEGKNATLGKVYQLYDNGLNESLLGNYKYSLVQLNMAHELLQEHGQANSSLAVSVLSGIASSAEKAKDYSLARSTYEKLSLMRPQDTQILFKLAQLEASCGHFTAAQNASNRILNLEPNNTEARALADLISARTKEGKNH